METFSALLALSAGIYRSPMNSLHKGKWRGALMFSLICALNKRFSKQSWGWWFETPLRSLWRHFNVSYVRSWQIVFWCVARESTHVTCQLIEMVSLSKPAITHPCIHRTPILPTFHYDDVIMSTIASQITSPTIVYSTVYSGADQSKHQSAASLAFVWGIHRGPVNSPHKWPVTRKMFPFDDVIMYLETVLLLPWKNTRCRTFRDKY